MKSIARSTFLKLALIPLTAALAGTLMLLTIYWIQPSPIDRSTDSSYQQDIGLVQTGAQINSSDGPVHIL